MPSLEPRLRSKWIYRSVFSLLVFLCSLGCLQVLLAGFAYQDVLDAFHAIRPHRFWLAFVFTFASYLAYTVYDTLALRYVGSPAPYKKLAPRAFIAGVLRSNAGVPSLDGGNLRTRLYSGWSLSGAKVAKVLLFGVITYWLGLTALVGITFTIGPSRLSVLLQLPTGWIRSLGMLLGAATCAYLVLVASRTTPLSLKEWDIPLPSVPLAFAQIAVAGLDWVASAAALYVFLPETATISFGDFLGLFLICQTVNVLSPIPGGLGVFECLFIFFLSPYAEAPALVAAALGYRLLNQVLPIVLAAMLLGFGEELQNTRFPLRTLRQIGNWTSLLIPHVLAVATFLTGVILLLTGATPVVSQRLALLSAFITLPVVEVSHFLGSIVGASLLILARGIQRKLDTAYWATVVALFSGLIFSLLNRLGYEEAILLGVVLSALIAARRHFWRKGSFTAGGLDPGWMTAILAVFASAIWIAAFAYRHVAYSDLLWWRFLLADEVPLPLRATAGAMCVLLFFGVAQLFRPARMRPSRPIPDALAHARRIIETTETISGWRALAGDKMLLFNDKGSAFLMYGIQGDSWIALGDPVGAREEMADLVWAFHEMCDRYAGQLLFYQLEERNLHLYIDLGLAIYRLGEEAHVSLPDFTLAGGEHRRLRHACHHAARAGLRFEVVPAPATDAVLAALEMVSAAWLKAKNTHEKGFSVGAFDPAYLRNFPVALVYCGERIVAFANVLCSAGHEELSLDLMRAEPDAPYGVMEYLFAELMLWGQKQGFASFNLGIAPLSDAHEHLPAKLWDRVGAFIFHYGEHFYNFRGVRDFKEQFRPRWSSVYFASDAGIKLPRVLADLAALIAGGYRGVLSKQGGPECGRST